MWLIGKTKNNTESRCYFWKFTWKLFEKKKDEWEGSADDDIFLCFSIDGFSGW